MAFTFRSPIFSPKRKPWRPKGGERSAGSLLFTTVVFDRASTSGYEAALSTYNWNHTVANQANRTLIVGVSVLGAGSVSGITADGVAMSFIRADTNGVYRSEIWQLIAPTVGTIVIAVTLSGVVTSIANAQSYFNSDQTAMDANNGNNGTNTPASASITSVADLCTVVGNLAAQSASGITSAAGQYSRTTANGALGTGASDDFGDITPAGSKTLTWNGLGALDSWAVSLVTLRPPQPVVSTANIAQFIWHAAVDFFRAGRSN